MKILSIIPARYNSTRLLGKPLVDILGKTMIQHVYEKAKQSKYLTGILIATDSEKIKRVVENFGGNAVKTSKEHLSGTDRIAEVAKGADADIIVNIQGDEPLISPKTIDKVIEPFLRNNHILMTTVMTKLNEVDYNNPNVVKVVTDKNNNALYFSRSLIPYPRNKSKSIFYKHIGLYAYKKELLLRLAELPQSPLEQTESLEQLRVLENGYKIKCVYVEEDTISVDTKEDLKKVILKLKEMNENDKKCRDN
jgi:3-deoxy-manno-octulosonate cytidylyltransferase (CMP-KDO synthetase)